MSGNKERQQGMKSEFEFIERCKRAGQFLICTCRQFYLHPFANKDCCQTGSCLISYEGCPECGCSVFDMRVVGVHDISIGDIVWDE